MILFRVINDEEYSELFKDIPRVGVRNRYSNSSKKNNTFNYCDGIKYMHFFKFAERARKYMHQFGNRIIMCDIPDDLIDQSGYGFYKYITENNISISVPIPEYIIRRAGFKRKYIIEEFPNGDEYIKSYNDINGAHLYKQILQEQYEKCIAEQGSSSSKGEILCSILRYLQCYELDSLLWWYASEENKNLKKLRKMDSTRK